MDNGTLHLSSPLFDSAAPLSMVKVEQQFSRQRPAFVPNQQTRRPSPNPQHHAQDASSLLSNNNGM